jgi:hypothetical protein
MSDVRINTRSPYYIEANPTEPTIPETPEVPDPPTNIPPTVTITASNTTPYAGDTVTLTAVATDSDGTIVSYLWGGTSSPQTSVSIDVTSTEVQSKIFNVIVTDDDGDVGLAQITINWQEIPEQTTNTDLDVNCGDVINEGSFIGTKTYNLVGVGDKIGDVEIEFLTSGNNQNLPVIFDLSWNGATTSTGYIGHSDFSGTFFGTDNTGDPTTKAQPTTLTINKSAATPTQVTLTASTGMSEGNDAYSFRLNCPDVEETITKFYTVKSTTAGGTTDFTYTDVNGDNIDITLEEGETELISAQEDTVSITSGTGTIEEGGQSFDLGQPEQTIDGKTEITIVFDSSGSMGTILDRLLKMADNELKNTLLTYYNNDIIEYNKRVQVVKSQDHAIANDYFSINKEDFLKLSSTPIRNSDSSKQIFLYFTNEVSGDETNYQDDQRDLLFVNRVSDYTTANAIYDSDLSNFRTFLESKNYGDYFLTVFNARNYPNYETYFINNIFRGDEGFDGSKGLSDRSEVSVVQPVLQTGDSAYYHDLIIEALRGYGFNI